MANQQLVVRVLTAVAELIDENKSVPLAPETIEQMVKEKLYRANSHLQAEYQFDDVTSQHLADLISTFCSGFIRIGHHIPQDKITTEDYLYM